MQRTLVAIPYHEAKRYCLTELFDWIRDAQLPFTNVQVNFHRGTYGERDAVKTQRENFRKQALNLIYTHLFFVGADTIPPLDALPKLLVHQKDVVGGVYYGRSESGNGLGHQAVAWKHKEQDLTKRENLEKQTGLMEVDGMGMDCVLLSRAAYENVSFKDWEQNDDDYPFYDRLKEKGFKIYLDTSVVCKHYYKEGLYN